MSTILQNYSQRLAVKSALSACEQCTQQMQSGKHKSVKASDLTYCMFENCVAIHAKEEGRKEEEKGRGGGKGGREDTCTRNLHHN